MAACALVVPASAQAACDDTTAAAAAGRLRPAATARSLQCLLNAERARHGLARVRADRRLRRAATRHSRDMAGKDYFAHGNVSRRVRRAGYLRGAMSWRIGEALAWGAGWRGSPRHLLRALLHSPPHRAILLDGGYRDVGIGVVIGAPRPGVRRPALTVTLDFGRRR